MPFHILGWLFAGWLVGIVARLLMPGPQPLGCLMTSLCGIAGALLGGAITYAIWGLPGADFAPYAWPGYLISIVCAMLILWIANANNRPIRPV